VRARTLLVLLGLTAAALVLWRPGRGTRLDQVGVTAEIAGRWTTEVPAYADRFLEIRSDRVIFGRGAGDESSHTLVAVYLEPTRSAGHQYVLAYEGEDVERTPIELRLRVSREGLVLANQPHVTWTRSP